MNSKKAKISAFVSMQTYFIVSSQVYIPPELEAICIGVSHL